MLCIMDKNSSLYNNNKPGGSLRNPNFFLLRNALKDRPKGPPTANRQLPPTANRQQPPNANHQPPPTTNRQPRPLPTATNCHQPPPATNRQPPIATNHGSTYELHAVLLQNCNFGTRLPPPYGPPCNKPNTPRMVRQTSNVRSRTALAQAAEGEMVSKVCRRKWPTFLYPFNYSSVAIFLFTRCNLLVLVDTTISNTQCKPDSHSFGP